MQIQIPTNATLKLVLFGVETEGKSWLGKINDYVEINAKQKYYGSLAQPIEIKHFYDSEEIVSLKFMSDYITTKVLSKPKGFLIYYECTFFTFFLEQILACI